MTDDERFQAWSAHYHSCPQCNAIGLVSTLCDTGRNLFKKWDWHTDTLPTYSRTQNAPQVGPNR